MIKELLAELAARDLSPPNALGKIECAATRNGLLKVMYERGVVEAAPFSAHSADKLFFAKLVEALLPEDSFHPKTRSLPELLPDLEANLKAEFPLGYVVKLVGSMNSEGEGVILSGFLDLFRAQPEKFLALEPEVNGLTGVVSSGERFLVQELLGGREREFRLHTLEGRVVRGATYTRWDQGWDRLEFRRAEDTLQSFLDRLPSWFTARQAWSVDLIDSGEFRLVEVNTNRGRSGHWSGDLVIPDTLMAYAQHLTLHYGALFEGEAEAFLRGKANLAGFLEKFGAEAVARHQKLRNSMKS
jgi:hypothetical protein